MREGYRCVRSGGVSLSYEGRFGTSQRLLLGVSMPEGNCAGRVHRISVCGGRVSMSERSCVGAAQRGLLLSLVLVLIGVTGCGICLSWHFRLYSAGLTERFPERRGRRVSYAVV